MKETIKLTIKGITLDTRLQSSMLLDSKLQVKLTADEFRSFINLTVWVVTQVSDGAFKPDDAGLVLNLKPEHIERFTELELVEKDDAGNYRIAEAYWSWQSSREELQKIEDRRLKDRVRKQAKNQPVEYDQSWPDHWPDPNPDHWLDPERQITRTIK